jgi:peptidylamidoglycolate lyase
MKFGSGYITVLDENNKAISTPGGTEPIYHDNNLLPQNQATNTFIHPHDVCIDNDENIYVCQWKANKTYPLKLERI